MGLSNKKTIFNLIRYEPGITRREIAKRTGLNPSTVTNIINSFKDMKLVYEKGKKKNSQPGRNSIKLEPIKEAALVFSFHMGVEQTSFAIGYLNNTIELQEEFKTENEPKAFFDRICEISRKYIEQRKYKPFGISLSFPGIVDRETNIIKSLPHIGWKDVDVGSEINNRMGEHNLQIQIANEAKLSLKSEKAVNSSIKDLRNGIYLYLSQGVGGALLINDRIYSGTDFIAGEIGHMSINKNGPVCHCGNRGCLETYIGVDMLIKQYEEHQILSGKNTREKFRTLLKLYALKDSFAVDTIDDMLVFMIQGITNLVNILNPDFLIIGGLGNEFPPEVFELIREKVKNKSLFPASSRVLLLPSKESIEQSALHGCTLEAMDSYVKRVVV
jgi:predicted NBD/HSP70 family sugar kinase